MTKVVNFADISKKSFSTETKSIQTSITPASLSDDLRKNENLIKMNQQFDNLQTVFDDSTYKNLPAILQRGLEPLTDNNERGVFLMGALGAISAILPSVTGFYADSDIAANLFIYVHGEAGSGKGALKYVNRMMFHINEYIKSQSPEEEIIKKSLFIPANSSAAAFNEILCKNEGKGLMFETEGDSLADTLKTDFGNFSASLRMAFHHERISVARKTGSYLIENPCLSVVISSTFGQLLSLIPNNENGLFSRFLFYETEPTNVFKNPFDKKKNNLNERYNALSERFFDLYRTLLQVGEVRISITDNQAERFTNVLQHLKDTTREKISTDFEGQNEASLNGTINRLGIITFRIAMVLTVLSNFENGTLSQELECTDVDFENALRIASIGRNNAYSAYSRLPKPRMIHNLSANKLIDKAEQKEKAFEMFKDKKSLGDISTAVFGDRTKRNLIQLWVNEFKKTK